MRDNLQKQFHERLNDAEIQPPPGAWERIDAQLPRRQPRRPLLRYSAALLLLISASAGAFLVYDRLAGEGSGKQITRVQRSQEPGTPGTGTAPAASREQSPVYSPGTSGKAGVSASPMSKKVQAANSGMIRSASAVSATVNVQQARQAGLAQSANSIQTVKAQNANLASVQLPYANNNGEQASDGLYAVPARDIYDPAFLLVSAGPDLIYPGEKVKMAYAGLGPGKPMPSPAFIPDRIKDDPEKIAKREERMKQFKTFDALRGFHLGGFVGMNMTWMSRKYDLIEHEGNIIDPKTHVGLTFGLIAGYDINENWGIQFEPALRNSKGQRFVETCIHTGEIKEKELTLRYFRFPFLMKYKVDLIGGTGRRPMVLSVLAGPMFNILSQRIMLESEEPVYVSPKFVNNAEFGAMAGLDLDFYISKNLYLTAGSRVSVTSPFERKKPLSIQWGLHTQFNFRMPPKEKIKH